MKLLLIGEAFGAEEELQNMPFVGPSGKLLRQALEDAGIKEFTLTNCCMFRPPENRKPTKEEIENCRPQVELCISHYDVIFLLGKVAHESYSPIKTAELSDAIGEMYGYEGKAYTSLYHPAYILRNRNMYVDYVNNLRAAVEYAKSQGFA